MDIQSAYGNAAAAGAAQAMMASAGQQAPATALASGGARKYPKWLPKKAKNDKRRPAARTGEAIQAEIDAALQEHLGPDTDLAGLSEEQRARIKVDVVISLGKGPYVIEHPIRVCSGVVIEGDDTVLRWRGKVTKAEHSVIEGKGVRDVMIRGVHIKGGTSAADRKETRKEVREKATQDDDPGESHKLKMRQAWADTPRLVGINLEGRGAKDANKDGVVNKKDDSNFTIADSEIEGCGKYGIHISGARDVRLKDNELKRNGTSKAYDHNIYLRRIADVDIEGGSSTKAAGNGLNIARANGVEIKDFKTSRNGGHGTRIVRGQDIDIDGLTANRNGEDGLLFGAEPGIMNSSGKHKQKGAHNKNVSVKHSRMHRNGRKDLHVAEARGERTFEDNDYDTGPR
ncbi:MAG: right-handed parallel beta-helix repeat-containing protein [Pseudomonadota bacterium]